MKLEEYLNEKNKAEFAREMGVDPSTVTYWCNGERFPSPKNIKKIQELTNDSVRGGDWYNV